jgi:hypothetical protein
MHPYLQTLAVPKFGGLRKNVSAHSQNCGMQSMLFWVCACLQNHRSSRKSNESGSPDLSSDGASKIAAEPRVGFLQKTKMLLQPSLVVPIYSYVMIRHPKPNAPHEDRCGLIKRRAM